MSHAQSVSQLESGVSSPSVMPTRWRALDRWWRVTAHTVRRACINFGDRDIRRWRSRLPTGRVLAQVRSELWSNARSGEFVLTAGKVQNLRRAARAFDGVVVPAGACLSFWTQLGRATRRRGFVRGRELMSGCVVPVVGGGLCQLSNAMATCAARAGLELVERHAHSVRPVGVGSEHSIDATVLWNYLDLRLRADHAWQLEVRLDAHWLIVRIRDCDRGTGCQPSAARPDAVLRTHVPVGIRSCVSCHEQACFRHAPQLRSDPATLWLLSEDTPEWQRHRRCRDLRARVLLPWSRRAARASAPRLPASIALASVVGMGWRRLWARHAGHRQASILASRRWLANAMAGCLRPEHRHVVIDQAILPFLWQKGVLGGRDVTVLAGALPMTEIERRLDRAMECQADVAARATLADFRVDPMLAAAEMEALTAAAHVLTTHAEVARHLRGLDIPVTLMPWSLPDVEPHASPSAAARPLLVFPASAIARKGFGELLQVVRGLPVRLRILGAAGDVPVRAGDVSIERGSYADDWLRRASAVVLPAHVEHRPRALLAALAAGLPVIASAACGIDHMPGVTTVVAGDVEALRQALLELLERLP